jgi:predicted peroxiredoxin
MLNAICYIKCVNALESCHSEKQLQGDMDMSVKRKIVSALSLSLAIMFPAGAMAATSPTSEQIPAATAPVASNGLYVVVTSPDPMTQMMAMVISTQTVAQGRSVRVLLCDAAGKLALKGSKETTFKPSGKSPQALLKGLIAKGVKVEVCALYLPNTGKKPADLIDGVGVAQPPAVAEAMAADGVKLFTF